jgi:hypothetical protein
MEPNLDSEGKEKPMTPEQIQAQRKLDKEKKLRLSFEVIVRLRKGDDLKDLGDVLSTEVVKCNDELLAFQHNAEFHLENQGRKALDQAIKKALQKYRSDNA